VERDVLLGHEACANACAEVLVQEAGHFGGVNVFSAFEETTGEDGYGVGVGLDEVGEDIGEADLIFKG
jgi:hypothetical protein